MRTAAVACLSDMQSAFQAAVAVQKRRSEAVSASLDAYLQQRTADLATVQVVHHPMKGQRKIQESACGLCLSIPDLLQQMPVCSTYGVP